MSDYYHHLSSETVTAAIHTALREQKRGNIEGARTLIRGLTLSQPDDPRVWLVLATVAETRDEQRQALERVAELSPDHPLAQQSLARFESAEPKSTPPSDSVPRLHDAVSALSSTPGLMSEFSPAPHSAPMDARKLDPIPPTIADYTTAAYQQAAPQKTPDLEYETKVAPTLASQLRWPLYIVTGVVVLLAFAAFLVIQSSYGQQDSRPVPPFPGALSSAPPSDGVVNSPADTEYTVTTPTPEPVVVVATEVPQNNANILATNPTEVPAPQPPPVDVVATDEPALSIPSAGVLQRVQERGVLICGTNADLPGFGFYDNVRDQWSGFDVDFCRVVAAAVLGDANAVEYVGLTTSGPNERFEAVRSGRVDVLFRNTTWTLGRDLSGLAFGPTTFHDGQTFMVRVADNITTLDDLEGLTICVLDGTTTQQNLLEDFAARGNEFIPLVFSENDQMYPAYDNGDCDAVTSDSSQLASKRETFDNPDDHIILVERISREPLGPAFVENDEQWRDIVSWAVFATMYAEELRVNQSNVDRLRQTSADPRVRRLLGVEGTFGEELGIVNDFGYQVLRQVGNYADIYDRNLGPNTPFELERGPNKAWNLGAGGVLASPPFR